MVGLLSDVTLGTLFLAMDRWHDANRSVLAVQLDSVEQIETLVTSNTDEQNTYTHYIVYIVNHWRYDTSLQAAHTGVG